MKWLERKAEIENIDSMTNFVLSGIKEEKVLSKKLIIEIKLICEEILTNIIKYAYPLEKGEVKLGYYYDKYSNTVTLRFCDAGIEFDSAISVIADIKDIEIGGRGLHIVRKLVDTILYERIEEENILTITKIFIEV